MITIKKITFTLFACALSSTLSSSTNAEITDIFSPETEAGPSSVNAALEIFKESNGTHYPRNLVERPTTLHEDMRQASLSIQAAGSPGNEPRTIPSMAFGADFRYGWDDAFETSLTLPRFAYFYGPSTEMSFFNELSFAPRYRFLGETYMFPSGTLTARVAALNNGVAFGGELLAEKRFGLLKASLTTAGRHRIHYESENYWVISFEPALATKVTAGLSLSLGFKASFYLDASDARLEDILGGQRENHTSSLQRVSTVLGLAPLLNYAANKKTDLFLSGMILLNNAAQESIGHHGQMGLTIRL